MPSTHAIPSAADPAWRRRGAGVCLLAMGMLLVGCESIDTAAHASVNSEIGGTWGYTDSLGRQSTLTLTQDADASVTGTGSDGATVSGLVSGEHVDLTATYASSTNAATHLSGALNGSTNMLSGTFTNAVAQNGTWVAVRSK